MNSKTHDWSKVDIRPEKELKITVSLQLDLECVYIAYAG